MALDEKRAAVSSVLQLLPKGERADEGADARPPAGNRAEAGSANAAN